MESFSQTLSGSPERWLFIYASPFGELSKGRGLLASFVSVSSHFKHLILKSTIYGMPTTGQGLCRARKHTTADPHTHLFTKPPTGSVNERSAPVKHGSENPEGGAGDPAHHSRSLRDSRWT